MPEVPDVPLITDPVMTRATSRSILDLDPGLGRTMGAAFNDAMVHNPTQAVNRLVAQSIYGDFTEGKTGIGSGNVVKKRGFTFTREGGLLAEQERQQEEDAFFQRMETNQNWLSRDVAIQHIEESGFTTSEIPISRGGANLFSLSAVIRGKVAERKREEILLRGSKGRRIPILAAGLGASILDPINIGSSFIPVVPASRYVDALRNATGRFGRALVRARVGAIEGATGAAVVEPLILLASDQDLLHYSIEDTILNVMFGAALGGGMHLGIGYMGDGIRLRNGLALDPEPHGATAKAVNKIDPALRQKAFESAILAAVRDRGLVVDQLVTEIRGPLKVGEKFSLPESLRFDVEEGAIVPVEGDDLNQVFDDLLADAGTPESVRRIIQASETPEQAIDALGKLSERQNILAQQNIDDVKNILGSGATRQDVVRFQSAIEQQFKEFGDEIQGIASRSQAGTDFDLRSYSDAFESPNNLHSFDETRIAEVDTINQQVPEQLDDTFVESQVTEAESVIREFEEFSDAPDEVFRADVEAVNRRAKEEARLTNLLLQCMLGVR